MAASGFTPIQLYYSTTSGHAPVAGNLLDGELAINTAEGKLYYKNSSGVVSLLAGLSGFSGFSGYSGYSGSGISGYSGSGISGYSGSGISGYSGFSGYSGSGISGYSGASGFSGTSGFSGQGVSGYSGISGYSGTAGGSGTAGTSGYSGFSGYSGTNGSAGTSGFSGYSGGTGSSGTSGYSGFSGASGFSGSSGYSGATGPTTYPSAGLAVSTGSAWGASLPDPLQVSHGGTGLTTMAAGYVPFGSTSTALSSNSLFNWDNTNTRLGVGITTPVNTLHVRGGNSNNAAIDNDGSQFTTLGWYNNGTSKAQGYWDQTNLRFVLGTDTASPMILKTNTTGRLQISAAGGVSIGTSTDAGANNLLVNGDTTANSFKTANFTIVQSGTKLYFYYGATAIASLDSAGSFVGLANVTAYGTP